MAYLTVANATKRFGDTFTALKDVSIAVERGEFFTLLGPSGCGKTTLLRSIAGFNQLTSGSILIEGRDLGSVPPHKRDIGMVFQRYSLFPHLSVRDNIGFPLDIRKQKGDARERRVDAMLKLVQLEKFAQRRPAQLSGGQQQRVAIARALVYEPRILLMDEPLGALDKKLREDLQDELRHLHRRLGITIVYVTHDQEEAMRLSQRIAIFSHGKIVGLGSGYDLYQNPPNTFVASFLGNSNFLRVQAQGNAAARFESASLAIRPTGGLREGQDLVLMIRPEKALALSAEQAAAQPLQAGWNELGATVQEVVFLGESQTCSVTTVGGTTLTLKALSGGQPLHPGSPVRVRWAAADACVYSQWNESDLVKGAH